MTNKILKIGYAGTLEFDKEGQPWLHSPMGFSDSVAEAALARKALHHSHDPYLYEVDPSKTKRLKKTTGMGRYYEDCAKVTKRLGEYSAYL